MLGEETLKSFKESRKERNFDRKKLPMFAIIIIFVIIIMILFIYVVPSLRNLLLDY